MDFAKIKFFKKANFAIIFAVIFDHRQVPTPGTMGTFASEENMCIENTNTQGKLHFSLFCVIEHLRVGQYQLELLQICVKVTKCK